MPNPATKQTPPKKPAMKRPTKVDAIIKHLRRKKGASTAELIKTTGWQPHSVRAAMSRIRKTGTMIERSATKSGTSRYRITGGDGA